MTPVAPASGIADVMVSTVKFEVEASDAEIIVVEAYGNCDAALVDEAMNMPCVQRDVVVASVVVEKLLRRVTVNSGPALVIVRGFVPEHVVPPEHEPEMTPVFVRFPEEPPTTLPIVPEYESPVETVIVEVDTPITLFRSLTIASCPFVHDDDEVDSPVKPYVIAEAEVVRVTG